MKTTKAIIERAPDGSFSIYMDDMENFDYLVTATGKTAGEAIRHFLESYEDIRKHYKSLNKDFKETDFEFLLQPVS